jgi:hypothetical protein
MERDDSCFVRRDFSRIANGEWLRSARVWQVSMANAGLCSYSALVMITTTSAHTRRCWGTSTNIS